MRRIVWEEQQRGRTFDMRLVSYGPFGAERAGILANEQIFDLEKAMQAAGAEAPVSGMRLFLEQPAWRSTLDRAHAARDKVTPVALSTVRLGAPVPVPRSLIIAGANTKTHIAEAGAVLGEMIGPRLCQTAQLGLEDVRS